MVWALLSRSQDIFAVIGVGTVIVFAVRGSLKVANGYRYLMSRLGLAKQGG